MNTLSEALALARCGEVEKAVSALSVLVASGDLDALGHRAFLLKHLGRYEEAITDYDCLLERGSANGEAARQRADTLRQMGRVLEAAGVLLKILQNNLLDRKATGLLALCQEAAGNVDLPPTQGPAPGHAVPVQPMNPILSSLEGDPRIYPGSAFPEVGRMLYTITRCLRPSIVVETGCFIGYSSICIGQALEENGGGQLHSFDLFPDDSPIETVVAGRCKRTLQAARIHIDRAGLSHRITLHQGDSAGSISSLFRKEMVPDSLIDLAFIDGDHTIRGCLRDFEAIDPLLRPGGIVLLHDTVPSRCGWAGPRTLLEQLPSKTRGLYRAVNLPSPEGFGLAIIQKSGGELVGKWHPPLSGLLAEWFYNFTPRTRSAD